MNLTAKQTEALQLIADNANVIAVNRGVDGYLTINGNTENKLRELKLIEKKAVGTMVRKGHEIVINVWVLTAAGREILGLDETPAEVTETPAAQVEAEVVTEVTETPAEAAETPAEALARYRATWTPRGSRKAAQLAARASEYRVLTAKLQLR